MKKRITQHVSPKQTPQSQPIPGTDQVPNEAGGYGWKTDKWTRLDRFLVLGSEKGTYYIDEKKLTIENAQAVAECIKEDGARVVARAVEISKAGRAPKNDPALFVLAMCASPQFADAKTRKEAFAAIPAIARTGTHILTFAAYIDDLRGWGAGIRNAVAAWYQNMNTWDLSYQVTKYQNRGGWSHADVLRLTHPKAGEKGKDLVYKWVVDGLSEKHPPLGDSSAWSNEGMFHIQGLELVKQATTATEVVGAITLYGLTREMIPTQWLDHVAVWGELLKKMPVMATVRNLGKMTSVGLLKPMSEESATVVARLSKEKIVGAMLHPVFILNAMTTYSRGHGIKGDLKWSPVKEIVNSLDGAFYLAFANIVPTYKRILVGLDVSGSMSAEVAGMGLTCFEAAGAMALITEKTEPMCTVMAFDTKSYPLDISSRQRLDDVMKDIRRLSHGGTDCAQPFLWALQQNLIVDAFVIYTDAETWYGYTHPYQALQEYRRRINPKAKAVFCSMAPTGTQLTPIDDVGVLEVVGLDASVPTLIADFIREG